jgi:ribose-phosphate pyrophosphokinase
MIQFKAKTHNGEIIKSALSPFSFPAGEAHIKREDRRELEPTEIAVITPSPASMHDDLFALAAWSDYIYRNGDLGIKQVLVMPYAPAARADRGAPFGAMIYGKFIAELVLDQIVIFDPHSEVILDTLDWRNHQNWPHANDDEPRVTVVDAHELLSGPHAAPIFRDKEITAIIAPDKGARKRAAQVAKAWNLPLYHATKTRDETTGKLSDFAFPFVLPNDQRYLVVDDICDQGGTFMGLAKATGLPKENLDLYVSHGVFSGRAAQLENAYENVYATNSYESTNIALNRHTIPVLPLLYSKIR